jgi:hypothetical protein
LNLVLKLIEVVYLGVNVFRGVALVVLLDERLDLSEGFSTHVACDERNTLLLRYLFSLKHKEEVLLHEPVIELGTVSMVEIRLVDIDIVGLNRVGHVDVRTTRARRGSSCS